jgi:hypothetical protein
LSASKLLSTLTQITLTQIIHFDLTLTQIINFNLTLTGAAMSILRSPVLQDYDFIPSLTEWHTVSDLRSWLADANRLRISTHCTVASSFRFTQRRSTTKALSQRRRPQPHTAFFTRP